MEAWSKTVWICVLICGASGNPASAAISADFNADGSVDSADLNLLESCASGPGVPYGMGCDDKDMDKDGDVDQADFGIFQRCVGLDMSMELIPAGEFLMGDAFNEGFAHELPRHAVYVDAFYMDRHEVTNQQYADALNWAQTQGNLVTITGGVVYKYNSGTSYPYCDTTTSSSYSRITWDGSTFGVTSGKENHPMVSVSWYGAVAYANWRSAMAVPPRPPCYDLSTWDCNFGSGYRLPTEAEWEKAARGGAAGMRFPWSASNDIQHARVNYYSTWSAGAPYYPYDTSPVPGYHPLWGFGDWPYTSPASFFNGALRHKADWDWPGTATSYQTVDGVNGYGLYDMAGNVCEWCGDWYSVTYYQWCVDNCPTPCPNPRGPASETGRVLRGGSSYDSAYVCRVASRNCDGPLIRSVNIGFRLALDSP